MNNRRSYRQFCGLARALDILGERWTLLIVRDLLRGPKRYGELLAGLPGLTTNLLAKRLRELEDAGVVEKLQLPPPASVTAYALSDRGRELEPAVMALGRWGGALLGGGPGDDTVNLAWGMTSLKRRYQGGGRGTVELWVRDDPYVQGDRCFQLRMTKQGLHVRDGAPWASVDTRVRARLPAYQALLFRGRSATALEASGALTVSGDRATWQAFVSKLGLEP